MPTDLRVVFPNRPGAFLEACAALATAGVNIEGFGGDIRPGEAWGFVHLLFEDPAPAVEALERRGLEIVDVHDVDVVEIENRPGALADVLRSYVERGENIEVLYTAAENGIVIGTESMRKPIPGVRAQDARYQRR